MAEVISITTLLAIGTGILYYTIVMNPPNTPRDVENFDDFIPYSENDKTDLPEVTPSNLPHLIDPREFIPTSLPSFITGDQVDPNEINTTPVDEPFAFTEFDTLGYGSYCTKDNQCSITTIPGGPPSSSSTIIGCCSNSCGFRKKNWRGSYKCTNKCRTCMTCKYGTRSKAPCPMTDEERNYVRKMNLKQSAQSLLPYKTDNYYEMDMDEFVYNNMNGFRAIYD